MQEWRLRHFCWSLWADIFKRANTKLSFALYVDCYNQRCSNAIGQYHSNYKWKPEHFSCRHLHLSPSDSAFLCRYLREIVWTISWFQGSGRLFDLHLQAAISDLAPLAGSCWWRCIQATFKCPIVISCFSCSFVFDNTEAQKGLFCKKNMKCICKCSLS